MQTIILRVLLFCALTCIYNLAVSQPPRGPLVISPQVQADKKVTFRYLAPYAKDVRLGGSQFGAANLPMLKDTAGIWSVTVGPIKPDIYPYSFTVDGTTVMDPANVDFFPNERFKASLVDVPGFTPLIHAMRDVPHGSVTYEYYPAAQGTTGSLVVYTPPGYGRDPAKKYPVFYLISGTTDTEETFFKVGRANMILDNLIADGKASPMIVVMPYGNVEARAAAQLGGSKPADPAARESSEAMGRMKNFAEDLTKNVIPYIEQSYSTIADREHRAIGGFSRGGGQTLRSAFWNMDMFSWICTYSAYLPPTEMESSFQSVVSDPRATNSKLKLLWVSVGTEDFLYNDTAVFLNYLTSKNIRYKSLITGGGHTWMNVKTCLAETAQMLFK